MVELRLFSPHPMTVSNPHLKIGLRICQMSLGKLSFGLSLLNHKKKVCC